MTRRELSAEAKRLASLLKKIGLKIVFAESCTGGLVSASLTETPGISDHHCGSAVVYRLDTKTAWLDISQKTLQKPGPVSEIVAKQMAQNILKKTPAADLAASVTGHLGPHAPQHQDGLIYVAVAARRKGLFTSRSRVVIRQHRLAKGIPNAGTRSQRALRSRRQLEAAHFVLTTVRTLLEKSADL